MTVSKENQRQLLPKNTIEMMKWDAISSILNDDDDAKLRAHLEKGLDDALRPTDAPHYKTTLHGAVEKQATKCLDLILNLHISQEILNSPDVDGKTPLYVAVEKLNVEAVEKLLAGGANPNARNDNGYTPLHLLAYSAASVNVTSNDLSKIMKCTDLFLANPNIDLDALNKTKLTPLEAAAYKFPSKTSALEEFCKKLIGRGSNVQEKIKEKLNMHCIPKISIPIQSQISQTQSIAEIYNLILSNQSDQIYNKLSGNHVSQKLREAANWYLGSKKILYYVVDDLNKDGVESLLKLGADPWLCNRDNELPLHRALARSNHPIVNILIGKMKKNNKVDLRFQSYTLLKKVLENQRTNKTYDIDTDSNKCLQRLFEHDVLLDVNQKDVGEVNQTALHFAADVNNQEAMAILLQHGAYLGEHKVIFKSDNGTVLKALMGKTLDKAMDNCIKVSSEATEQTEDMLLEPNYTLEMNYRFLMKPQSEDISKGPDLHNEATVLYDVSQSKEHRNSLKHPLIQTLLYAKWSRVFPLYILNLLLYFAFVVFLTMYMYALKNLRILERLSSTGNYTDYALMQSEINHHQIKRGIIMVFVLIVTIYIAVKEVFQIKFTYKTYFRRIENYLEWFLVVAVLISCIFSLSVDATRHLAAWAMVAAWYEFVLVLGRAPPLAIYITMLRHVSWNFLKLVFLFGFLIIAFSVSFNIILQPSVGHESDGDFAAFWTTLPRAIVMSTGEFEYSAISEDLSKNPIFATSTVLIFLVFLFLIFLVLMNVMTGLAVTDAKEIVEDAILYSLKSRLEVVYLNEQLFMKVPFLQKMLHRLHLLDAPQRQLKVRINMLPKGKRVCYEKDGKDKFCELDNRTAEILRTHRLHRIAEMRAEREGTPTTQILELLREIRGQVSITQHIP